VGRSGAGKSTVAALLSRFYIPQSGEILLNGQEASSFTRGEWAKAVALVNQEPVLFDGSVADNIAYGRFGRCSQADIMAAAEAANAHEFIMRLPDGYNTLVGERGALLSGEWWWAAQQECVMGKAAGTRCHARERLTLLATPHWCPGLCGWSWATGACIGSTVGMCRGAAWSLLECIGWVLVGFQCVVHHVDSK
jgi:hypothetical protein